MVEHRLDKAAVGGSIPPVPTSKGELMFVLQLIASTVILSYHWGGVPLGVGVTSITHTPEQRQSGYG